MAHTKAKGAARINKDSISKRLGIKRNHGQIVKSGMILVRQRGSKYREGQGVGRGKDYTLYALHSGRVQFYNKQGKKYIAVASL